MYRLIYISQRRSKHPADGDVSDILAISTGNNLRLGITGALFHSAATFVQVLEGDRASVEAVFSRIRADPRHGNVTLLHDDEVKTRWFGNWSMAYVALSGTAEPGGGDVVSQMAGDDVLSFLSALVAGGLNTPTLDAFLAAKVSEVQSEIASRVRAPHGPGARS